MFCAVGLCAQNYSQRTAKYIVLVLLHVSATNCSHLQGDTVNLWTDTACSAICQP